VEGLVTDQATTDAPVEGPFVAGPRSRRPYGWLLFLALFMLVPGIVLVERAGHDLYVYQWQLQQDPVKTEARITDLRTMEPTGTKHSTRSWDVKYSFKVRGDDTTYHAADGSMFGSGDDAWVNVSEDRFEASRESGRIDIEYLKDDPSVNQPSRGHRGMWNAIAFAVVGLFMLAIGLLLLRGALRPIWRGRTPRVEQP
jgi:hypothetical protein